MAEYISREAVVRYLKGYSEKECNSNSPYGMITSSVLNKAERALSEMPVADVQPVKRGRWLNTNTPNQLRCSSCDVIHFIAQYPHGDINYCPNCGADMREPKAIKG